MEENEYRQLMENFTMATEQLDKTLLIIKSFSSSMENFNQYAGSLSQEISGLKMPPSDFVDLLGKRVLAQEKQFDQILNRLTTIEKKIQKFDEIKTVAEKKPLEGASGTRQTKANNRKRISPTITLPTDKEE
jgi:hypothetical protein